MQGKCHHVGKRDRHAVLRDKTAHARIAADLFGIERDADLAALRLMRFMSDFREAMWGVLQSGISELDFDFKGYAAKHFGRMELTSSDPAFVRFLER